MEQVKAQVIVVFVVLAVIFILFDVAAELSIIRKIEQLRRYWKVEIGMSEHEMLDIMGDGYNRSLLQNNRVKYEWCIKVSILRCYYKGVSTHPGVRKVDIYVKDGYVEEIISDNV